VTERFRTLGRLRRLRIPRPRTLRVRIGVVTALSVFAGVTLASLIAFYSTARALGLQIEATLQEDLHVFNAVIDVRTGDRTVLCNAVRARGEAGGMGASGDRVAQLTLPDGTVCTPAGLGPLREDPDPDDPLGQISGTGLIDLWSEDGVHYYGLRETLDDGSQLIIGRAIGDTDRLIGKLRGVMGSVSIGGALVGLAIGVAVVRLSMRPVARLADSAEHIARTEDLSVPIDVPDNHPTDEVTRLASAFERMTGALSAARERQARLVADAGHELRTPLTSLRTNLDLLMRSEAAGRPLPPGQREALLRDLVAQTEEMSTLVGQLVVLAGDESARSREAVRLDHVVQAAVDRARRRSAGHTIDTELEPCTLPDADAEGLERAVVNVLDNALKFSPPGSTVSVRLRDGTLTVDDAGPGVPAGQRGQVFERFWRADDARSMPGSGLGLAIVADTVTAHGGNVRMLDSPAGGARVVLTVPVAPQPPATQG
jgi:two-component system sensor histidine kinase MprB